MTDPTYLAFADPLARPLHFAGLEVVFAACFALTVRHAVTRYRRGDRYHAFQWLVIFAYGVAMELVAFNAFDNYEHGQFTVELYHRKLPLYVTFVYVVFHYTGLKIIEAWRLGRVAEALLAGLAICLLDAPFDLVGVDARWWTWAPSDHDIAQRWLGVPLTSFYWYMLFGAILAALCRAVRGRVERLSLGAYVAIAPVIALAVIVLGIVGFLPFHGFEALGVSDGVLVAAHASACVIVAARANGASRARVSRSILAIPIALFAWHGVVLATLWAGGGASLAPSKLAVIVAAGALVSALAWRPGYFPVGDAGDAAGTGFGAGS